MAENERKHIYMPTDLWDKLQALAKEESRSVSAQIVHILRQFFKGRK